MSDNIMVSICCITYNQEKYIATAIESFLMQKTNFKYEVIIHDDASTDNTTKIIREYQEKYPDIIKPIYQSENQYSKGIIPSQLTYKKAQGKYITICEGDDYWTDENKLQKQVDFLEKNNDYIATSHWCEVVDINGNVSNDYPYKHRVFNFKKETYTFKDYQKNEIPGHVNTIMFRNIYTNAKYDYGKIYYASRLVGDRTTYLIIALSGKIHVIPEFMSSYRYVIMNNGTNYCSVVKNKNKLYDWFKYYNNLEKGVYEVMNKKISLKRLKYDVFIEAVITYIKTPKFDNKEVLIKIINEYNKLEVAMYLPIIVIRRIKRSISFKLSK
ncbi:MAG: glycosyltransferase [Terrisporobacter sp.]